MTSLIEILQYDAIPELGRREPFVNATDKLVSLRSTFINETKSLKSNKF